ncbi:MAG: polysaccharide biosynthesis protein [Planctomycetes bacterium]|nr:polysaccharide biosynthesis protein [Planctomycetota bacterium]
MIRSISSNWALSALQIVVLMFLTPFTLRTLGADQNGVWVTVVSLTGVLRLLVLGVPMASVKSIAEARGRGDLAGVNRAISTCLAITLAMGAAALALGWAQLAAFEHGYLDGALGAGLTPDERAAAQLAFVLAAVQVAAAFVLRLPYGVLEAHEDFTVRNGIMALELFARAGLTVALLPRSPDLATLAWILVATMVLEFALAWLAIARRHAGVRFSLASFDRSLVRGILSFSVFAMLLNVGTLLAFRCDALVIGHWLDAQATTQFDLGNKFFEPLTGLVIGIGAVVMPAATRLKSSGKLADLRPVLLRWTRISFLLVLTIGTFLLLFAHEFFSLWVGSELAGAATSVLRVLMASFLVYLPIRGVSLPILMGLGQPLKPAVGLLVMGAVNVALSIALVGPFELIGVALGTALPNLAFSLFVASLACRELGVPAREFLSYGFARPLLGALPAVALVLGYKELVTIDTWWELFAGGALCTAALGVVWVCFLLRDDPWITLPGPLARRGGRS